MELSRRKHIRLKDYDYSQNGVYFITICTHKRRCLFPFPAVGAAPCGRPNRGREIVQMWLTKLPDKFPGVSLSQFAIMPNHVHLLLHIDRPAAAGGHTGPPLPNILDWYKTMTTTDYIKAVRAGELPPFEKHIWQRGYYEHAVRNDQDYQACWQYIAQNPARWAQDEYFTQQTTGGAT